MRGSVLRGGGGGGGQSMLDFAGHLKDFIVMGMGSQLSILRREEDGSPVRSLVE